MNIYVNDVMKEEMIVRLFKIYNLSFFFPLKEATERERERKKLFNWLN